MGGCLCVHTGLHRGKEQRPFNYGMAQTNVGLALPAWPQCPLLPRKPDELPQMAASSCLLANGGLLFYLLLEENSLSLWVCCGSNKLPLFLPTLKHYKKQQSGQVIAFWEESHKSEHNGGKRQLYLCTRTCACVCFCF